MLYLRIGNPQARLYVNTMALIDTGADACAVPAPLAASLGHDLETGPAKRVGTASGVAKAYSHRCKAEVFDTNALQAGRPTVVYVTEDVEIDFLPNLRTVLLGVRGFLNRFVLSVDYPKRTFSLRRR